MKTLFIAPILVLLFYGCRTPESQNLAGEKPVLQNTEPKSEAETKDWVQSLYDSKLGKGTISEEVMTGALYFAGRNGRWATTKEEIKEGLIMSGRQPTQIESIDTLTLRIEEDVAVYEYKVTGGDAGSLRLKRK